MFKRISPECSGSIRLLEKHHNSKNGLRSFFPGGLLFVSRRFSLQLGGMLIAFIFLSELSHAHSVLVVISTWMQTLTKGDNQYFNVSSTE